MSEPDNAEVVFFRYKCSNNDGLISLVEPDSANLHHYEERECETLESIIWWERETQCE